MILREKTIDNKSMYPNDNKQNYLHKIIVETFCNCLLMNEPIKTL